MKPQSVEFLVHMSLAAAVASVNSLAVDGHVDTARVAPQLAQPIPVNLSRSVRTTMSHSEHTPQSQSMVRPMQFNQQLSVTGGRLDMQWKQLRHVEYLTDGGNSWIHTAILDGRPVVVKTLKPECQDVALAINEIESELCRLLMCIASLCVATL
jgi:SH3-like domain-containing protein